MTEHQPEAPALPGVTRWQAKRVIVEAHQWHANGDHPADNCRMITPDRRSTTQFAPFMSEGEIVRYYRNPDDSGERECGDCATRMHDHGWIDQGTNGRVVCPGDWIVSLALSTPGLTARFPVKPDVFAAIYEPADGPEPDDAPQVPLTALMDAEARAEAAEAKLAAIKELCRDNAMCRRGLWMVTTSDVLGIIGGTQIQERSGEKGADRG